MVYNYPSTIYPVPSFEEMKKRLAHVLALADRGEAVAFYVLFKLENWRLQIIQKRTQNSCFYCNISSPKAITYDGTNIEEIRNATEPVAVTIKEGITSIQDDTFKDCTKLTSIIIPEGVISIGHTAFSRIVYKQRVL